MKSVEEIMEEQLRDYIKNFKPVFGSEIDINIIHDQEKLKRLQKMFDADPKPRIADDIKMVKRHLLFNFKRR